MIVVMLLLCSTGYAQQYQLNYPFLVYSAEKRAAFAQRAQEELRLVHNVKGKEFRDGVITEAEWNIWKEGWFKPRQRAISMAISEIREIFKNSDKYEVKLDEIFDEITP